MSSLKSHWHDRYLELAQHISKWSKDPSKQIGAIVIGSAGQVLAQGYNGFPRGIADHKSDYANREIKYTKVVHAEMNAIYNASRTGVSLEGSTMYVYGLPVCHECAKGIIQVGIKHVVMRKTYDNSKSRWKDSCTLAEQLFKEAGVSITYV